MKKIDKQELFEQVSQFLKTKGIELQQGSYSRTIEKGCQVLADTINLSQEAVERARSEVQKTLEQVRQVIHKKTAPRKPSGASQSERPRTSPRAQNNSAAPESPKPPIQRPPRVQPKPKRPRRRSESDT